MIDIDRLLVEMDALVASDLFLKVHARPCFKVSGRVIVSDYQELDQDDLDHLGDQVLREREKGLLAKFNQADFSYAIPGQGRYRGNIYRQRGTIAAVFRRINTTVPTSEELGLPEVVKTLAMERRGMVLVTGATGSGKSTTLAAMVDWRNENTHDHIITIEDPIEFLHTDKGCIISQREVGMDVDSFHDGLRAALRQAPDVLLMGELRDEESADTALHLAETGHLVLGTLHSTNANQTLERLLQFFPASRHPEIMSLLAFNLRGIISQRLIRGVMETYCLATEVMIGTPRVRELLKRGDVSELKMAISQGDREGMHSFDQSIYRLYEQGHIDEDAALAAADSPNDVRLKMRGFIQAQV